MPQTFPDSPGVRRWTDNELALAHAGIEAIIHARRVDRYHEVHRQASRRATYVCSSCSATGHNRATCASTQKRHL